MSCLSMHKFAAFTSPVPHPGCLGIYLMTTPFFVTKCMYPITGTVCENFCSYMNTKANDISLNVCTSHVQRFPKIWEKARHGRVTRWKNLAVNWLMGTLQSDAARWGDAANGVRTTAWWILPVPQCSPNFIPHEFPVDVTGLHEPPTFPHTITVKCWVCVSMTGNTVMSIYDACYLVALGFR